MADDAPAKPAADKEAKPAPKKPEKPPVAWPYPPQHKDATRTEDLDKVKERFGNVVVATGEMAAGKPVVYIDPASAWDVLNYCKEELGFDHCSFVSACDYNKEGILEVHWQLYAYPRDVQSAAPAGRDLVVKAHIPRDDARITSAVSLWAGCDWHEREAWDLFGIHFDGHPDLRRIFMPEGWRGHPLRKDYDRSPQYIGMNEQGEDVVYDKPGPYRW